MPHASPASSGRSPSQIAFAVAVILSVLALPMPLGRGKLAYDHFDKALLKRFVKLRPEIVMIGNSMLKSRIDSRIIGKLSGGRRIRVQAKGGSASSIWYLYLKNFALAADPPPKVAIILFRDTVLSLPGMRSGGKQWQTALMLMPEPDPDVLRLTGRDSDRGLELSRLPELLYPILAERVTISDRIHLATQDIVVGGQPKRALHDEMENVFRLGNLRRDLPTELNADDEEGTGELVEFDDSFLPLMFDAAKRTGTRLVFYRVRRRPTGSTFWNPDEIAALSDYMGRLRKYITERGGVLLDESDDERITIDFYADGDHLAEDHQRQYTEMFWERVKDYCR